MAFSLHEPYKLHYIHFFPLLFQIYLQRVEKALIMKSGKAILFGSLWFLEFFFSINLATVICGVFSLPYSFLPGCVLVCL